MVLPHKVVTRIFNVSGHLLLVGISHLEVHQAANIRGVGGQCAHRDAVKGQCTIFAVNVLGRMQPNTARTVNTDVIQCPHSNGHIFATATNLIVVEFEPVIFIGGIFFRRIVLPRTSVNTDSTFVAFGLKENLVTVRVLFGRHRMRDNTASTDTKRGMLVRHTEDCASLVQAFAIKVVSVNTGILLNLVVDVVFVILTVFLIRVIAVNVLSCRRIVGNTKVDVLRRSTHIAVVLCHNHRVMTICVTVDIMTTITDNEQRTHQFRVGLTSDKLVPSASNRIETKCSRRIRAFIFQSDELVEIVTYRQLVSMATSHITVRHFAIDTGETVHGIIKRNHKTVSTHFQCSHSTVKIVAHIRDSVIVIYTRTRETDKVTNLDIAITIRCRLIARGNPILSRMETRLSQRISSNENLVRTDSSIYVRTVTSGTSQLKIVDTTILGRKRIYAISNRIGISRLHITLEVERKATDIVIFVSGKAILASNKVTKATSYCAINTLHGSPVATKDSAFFAIHEIVSTANRSTILTVNLVIQAVAKRIRTEGIRISTASEGIKSSKRLVVGVTNLRDFRVLNADNRTVCADRHLVVNVEEPFTTSTDVRRIITAETQCIERIIGTREQIGFELVEMLRRQVLVVDRRTKVNGNRSTVREHLGVHLVLDLVQPVRIVGDTDIGRRHRHNLRVLHDSVGYRGIANHSLAVGVLRVQLFADSIKLILVETSVLPLGIEGTQKEDISPRHRYFHTSTFHRPASAGTGCHYRTDKCVEDTSRVIGQRIQLLSKLV